MVISSASFSDYDSDSSSTVTEARPSPLLTIKDLSVSTRNKSLIDIKELTLYQQRLTTFIGPNGAGKSTLLHSLLNQSNSGGLIRSGSITVTSPSTATDSQINKTVSNKISHSEFIKQGLIAWVGQHESYELPLTVTEYALLGVSPQLAWYQNPNQQHLIQAQTLLHDFELQQLSNSRVQTLSGGEKQRLSIVRSLMQNTTILMLDEPTNHLDIRHQRYLLSYLKRLVAEQNKTIIIVLHDLTHAYRYSDTVILMNQGKIVAQGVPSELMTTDILSPVYQVEISAYDTDGGRVFV